MDATSDLAFIKDADQWPQWPALPLKRYVENMGMEVGLLWGNAEPIIYLVNLWSIPPDLTTAPQIKYDNFESLVADGWKVD